MKTKIHREPFKNRAKVLYFSHLPNKNQIEDLCYLKSSTALKTIFWEFID